MKQMLTNNKPWVLLWDEKWWAKHRLNNFGSGLVHEALGWSTTRKRGSKDWVKILSNDRGDINLKWTFDCKPDGLRWLLHDIWHRINPIQLGLIWQLYHRIGWKKHFWNHPWWWTTSWIASIFGHLKFDMITFQSIWKQIKKEVCRSQN